MPAFKLDFFNDSIDFSSMTDVKSGQIDEIEFPNMLQFLIRNENCSLIECVLKPSIIISGLVFNLLWMILVLNKKQTCLMDSQKPFRYLLVAICVSHMWFLFDQFNFWVFAYFNRPDLTSFNGSCQFGSYFNYFFKVSIELYMLTANYILVRFCLRNYLNKSGSNTLPSNSMDIYNQFQIDYEPDVPRSTANKTSKSYFSRSLASSSSTSASISPSTPISLDSLSTRQTKSNKRRTNMRPADHNISRTSYSSSLMNFFGFMRQKQASSANETKKEEIESKIKEKREQEQMLGGKNNEEHNVSLIEVVSEATEVTRVDTCTRNSRSVQLNKLKASSINQSQPTSQQQQETKESDAFAHLKSSHHFLKLVETNKFIQEEVYFNIVVKEKMFIILITIVLLYMLSFILWIKGVSSLQQQEKQERQQQDQPDFHASNSHTAINLCVTYAFGKPLLKCLNTFVLVLRLLNLVMNLLSSFLYHWRFGKEYFRSLLNSFKPAKLNIDIEEQALNDSDHQKEVQSESKPREISLGKQLKLIYSIRSHFNLQHLREQLHTNKKLSQSIEAFLNNESESNLCNTRQSSKLDVPLRTKESLLKLRKYQLHYDHFEFVRFYAISIFFYTLLIAPTVLDQTYSKYDELRETFSHQLSKQDLAFESKYAHISNHHGLKLKLNSLIDSREPNKTFVEDKNSRLGHDSSGNYDEEEEKQQEVLIRKLISSLSKSKMNEKRSTTWTGFSSFSPSTNQTVSLKKSKRTQNMLASNNSSMFYFLSNLIKSNGENGDSRWAQFVTLTELLAHSINLLVYVTFSVHLKCYFKYYTSSTPDSNSKSKKALQNRQERSGEQSNSTNQHQVGQKNPSINHNFL
jgi:hypothetical protein